MDGAHDRPPGRTAENWSRTDRIRAGSVSGPWRSAPRAAEAASSGPAAAPVAPPAAPRGHAVPPIAAAGLAPDGPRLPATATRRPARMSRTAMTAWIGFGIVFAAGCVGLAFVFQPEGQPDGAVPVEPAAADAGGPAFREIESAPAETAGAGPGEAATAAAGEAARVPAPEPVTIAGVTSVRLRTGTGFAADERDGVVAALARAGLSEVQAEALPFAVASSRVGYYRPEDKAAAEALAAYIGPALGYGGPIAVRDYGQLLDDAAPGRLDLWIGG